MTLFKSDIKSIIRPMAVERGLYVIDGSHLFASIKKAWEQHPELNKRPLHLNALSEALFMQWSNYAGPAVRVIYYFREGDKRIDTMLKIPDDRVPGAKNHWQINTNAKPAKDISKKTLEKIAEIVETDQLEVLKRAEKGLDIELACEALQLVAVGRIDAVIFLINDSDYVPLFKAVHRLGANAYLTSLDSAQSIQQELAKHADYYQSLESQLNSIFDYTPPPPEVAG